jgi:hypothetical protein
MNFRGVVEDTEAGFEEDIKAITNPKNGDVILYKEQEYVYSNGIWVLFGDATGNAAAITALTERVATNETAIKTTLPAAIADAIKEAKDYTDTQIPAALTAYKVKDVDNVTLQLSDTGIASVKAISTDLLVQGTLELVLNGGSAN